MSILIDTLNEQKESMLNMIEDVQKRLSKIDSQDANFLALQEMLNAVVENNSYQKIRNEKLNKQSAKLLLQTYNAVSKDSKYLGKDSSGQSITKKLMLESKQLETKNTVKDLLKEIVARQDKANKEAKQTLKINSDFKDSLTVLLGPAGPFIKTFSDLKETYKDDVVKGIARAKKFLGLQKDEGSQIEKLLNKEAADKKSIFKFLTDKFKQFGNAIPKSKGLIGKAVDMLPDWMPKKIPGVGKLSKLLPKVGVGGLMKGAGAVGGLYGLYDITKNDVDAGAKGQDAMTTAGSYAQGALAGASIGLFVGGPVGAAVGGVLGLMYTGIVRNWTSVKDTLSKGYEAMTSFAKDAFTTTIDLGVKLAKWQISNWKKSKKAMTEFSDWFSDWGEKIADFFSFSASAGGGSAGGGGAGGDYSAGGGSAGGGGDASAPQGGSASEKAVNLLKGFEGYQETAKWDVNAERAGYGSDTTTDANGNVSKIKKGQRVNKEDAERDLRRRVDTQYAPKARNAVGALVWDKLPDDAKAALISVAYNYGSLPKNVVAAARTGDTAKIAEAVRALSVHNNGINAKRRNKEADIISKASGSATQQGDNQKFSSSPDKYIGNKGSTQKGFVASNKNMPYDGTNFSWGQQSEGGFERVPKISNNTVRMPMPQLPQIPQQVNNAIASVTKIMDIPNVLGDSHMVVVNSGMIGAY